MLHHSQNWSMCIISFTLNEKKSIYMQITTITFISKATILHLSVLYSERHFIAFSYCNVKQRHQISFYFQCRCILFLSLSLSPLLNILVSKHVIDFVLKNWSIKNNSYNYIEYSSRLFWVYHISCFPSSTETIHQKHRIFMQPKINSFWCDSIEIWFSFVRSNLVLPLRIINIILLPSPWNSFSEWCIQ